MYECFQKLKASRNIVSIDGFNLSEDEFAMLSSLQGIVAQSEAKIIIKNEESYNNFVAHLKSGGCTENLQHNAWSILDMFKSCLSGKGYIKYAPSVFGDVNLVATVSGAEKWLMVPSELEDTAIKYGLVKKYDFEALSGMSMLERKIEIFNKYKDKLCKNALVHQSPNKPQLRDLAIALRLFCFYTDEKDEADIKFRQSVFEWADNNIPVIGWTDDEIAFIKDCSEYGKFTIPMDWSQNHSYFAGTATNIVLKQTVLPQKIIAEKGKHYLAIVVSDGDNVQWITRDFSTTSTFGQRLRSSGNYKISWTFPIMLSKLGKFSAKYIYDLAGTNNSFIAGVSGVGYINCSSYPDKHLDAFTRLTSDLMKECDIDVVTLLDNRSNLVSTEFIKKKLDYYSRFDNIKGGIWELDPDRYESGKGEVFWSNNKPFMSVRLSFWHPSNNSKNVTNAWIDTYSSAINSFEKDPKKPGGYTILNVHPWTTNITNLERLVSKLEPHIQIVSASEIIGLAAENITNRTAN